MPLIKSKTLQKQIFIVSLKINSSNKSEMENPKIKKARGFHFRRFSVDTTQAILISMTIRNSCDCDIKGFGGIRKF